MADPGDQELERLRRTAFARGATDADLAALDDAMHAQVRAIKTADSMEEPSRPDDEAPLIDEAHRARRRRSLVAAVLGVVCVVAAAAGGWIVRGLAGDSETSALEVFETLPAAEGYTFVSHDLENADSRLLGEIGDAVFIGTLGNAPNGQLGLTGPMVCLWVQRDELGGGGCTLRDQFLENGVSFTLSGPNVASTTYYWGPDGPPGIVVCPQVDWTTNGCPPSD